MDNYTMSCDLEKVEEFVHNKLVSYMNDMGLGIGEMGYILSALLNKIDTDKATLGESEDGD